jgi:hypothetical protein
LFVLTKQCCHGCLTPKACTVLADLPAVSVSPTVSQRRLELMLRLSGENIFGRKEAGKVLPDYFIGMVTENAFSPCVPTEQMSFQSNKEYGVLLRVRGQQVKLLSHFL